MDIDISVLRLMEREKDLPFEVLASAIEDAYSPRTKRPRAAVQGARSNSTARPDTSSWWHPSTTRTAADRRIRHHSSRLWTGSRFYRPQVIMQRLRDAEDEQKYGHFSGSRVTSCPEL